MLTHLSLFSGIGGLDLAAEWAGFTTVGQCEWADYPTNVLKKHWPDVHRWRDIHDLSADEFVRRTGRSGITVISGGFPCQPHSLAGKRKASSDERDLWPEYRRIISEFRPKWVVAENVPGLLTSEDGRFFRGILRDLAGLGFNVGWCTYPAAWIGTLHRRGRIFVIAHSNSTGSNQCKETRGSSIDLHGQNRKTEKKDQQRKCIDGVGENGSSEYVAEVVRTMQSGWAAQSGICRVVDGIPDWMDRLKCLGNAVVPQQAYPIFKAIAEIELGN